MAWQLVTEVLDHAPRALSSAERLVLVAVAERARVDTRECQPSVAEVARRAGLELSSIGKVFARLRRHGLEVRVPFGVDRRGEPLFAVPGRALSFRVPPLVPPVGCVCDACRKGGPSSDLDPEKGGPVSDLDGEKGGPSSDLGGGKVGPSSGQGGPLSGLPGPSSDLQQSRSRRTAAARASDLDEEQPAGATAAERWRVADGEHDDAAALVSARFGDVDLNGAHRAVVGLLDAAERRGKPVAHVTSYVRAAIDRNPERVRRLAGVGDDGPGRQPALPPPCGECDARPGDPPTARLMPDETPCPRCYPERLRRLGARRAS